MALYSRYMAPAPVARPTTLLRRSSCCRHRGMVFPMPSVLSCGEVGARSKAPAENILEPEPWAGPRARLVELEPREQRKLGEWTGLRM